MSASAEDGASEFLSNPSVDPPPDGKVRTEQVDRAEQPERPELPEALLPQITQGEQLIDDVIAQNKPLNAKQEQLLLRAAEELSQVRTQSQGEQWWETLDARHRLTDLRKWLTLTPSQRADLAASAELSQQVWTLNREGKYKEALVPAVKRLDIERRIWGERHRNVARGLNDLAGLYLQQGTSVQALPLYEQALAIREQVLGPTHPETASSLNNLAELYRKQGQYTQAEPLLKRALAIWEQTLGPTHPTMAMSLDFLAMLYQDQGQYTQAEPLFKRALAIREQALGPTDPDTASSINNLAALYQDQAQYAQAEPLLKRSLAILEQTLGPTHPTTASSLNNLAEFYREQGVYARAEPLYKRALAIYEQALGPTHPTTASSLSNLAMLYHAQGAYAQALPLYERALTIREQVLGPTHHDTATSLNNLAALYQAQGQYTQAAPLLKRALAITEQTLGPTHPNTANSLNNLAGLYREQGEYAQAEPLLKRALAIWEQTLGPTHPKTALSLNNLAALYRNQRGYAQAEPLLKRALTIREQTLGPTHPDTANSLYNLAELYQDQGQYAQAESLLKRALAIQEQTLGPTNPTTALSLNNLAELYREQGAYSKALPLYERALTIQEQTLGPTHPNTANSLHNLAELYRNQGQYVQAEPLLKRVLAIREQALGPTHPETVLSLNNLAVLYQDQGQYAKAEPMLKRVLAIREQALGPTHPETALSLNNLAMLYEAQGGYAQAEPLLKRALAIHEQALGPVHPDTAKSLNNLAVLYAAQGAYMQALPLYERALAIHEQALGPMHPTTAQILGNLGIQQTRSQPDARAADRLLRSVKSRWQYLTDSFPTLTVRQQQQFLKKSRLEEDGYLWHVLAQDPKVDRAVGYQVTLWSKYLLTEVMRQESSAFQRLVGIAPAEWQALWRERQSLRQIYATRAFHELRPKTTPSTAELDTRLDQLEQRLRRENPVYAHVAKLQDITVAQVQQALQPDQALLEYVQFHPYNKTTKQLDKILHYGVYVVRGGQTSQGNQIPVITLDLGDAAPIDKVVRQFQAEMQRAEGYAKAKIDRSQKQIRMDEAKLAQVSSTLRRLVWQPVEKLLANVTRVYIAPDGQLSVFPFEALARKTQRGTWQYLVEEQRDLVYLNTGRDLARLALQVETDPALYAATRTAVLIGNPKFDARPKDVAKVVAGLPTSTPLMNVSNAMGSGGTLGAPASQDGFRVPRNWDQVQGLDTFLTHAEQQLRRTGWTVTTWRGHQAVEPIVLQLQAPRILQFATHGYFLEQADPEKTGSWENPLLRSMLLLSGVNHATPEQTVFYRVENDLLTEAQVEQQQVSVDAHQQTSIYIGDGILTAYEVTGMNLHGTELVNLTACQTGLGEVTSEGVVGLRQAFFFAGARALTTSLWEVPVNEATQQIENFYARWLGSSKGKSGMTRYAAFRQTQLAALAQARRKYGAGHPFFWAGFIYLGDPGDLAREKPGMRKKAASLN